MRKLTTCLIILSFLFLPSCSVYMASKKEGVSIDELSQCKTRSCILSKGATPLETKKMNLVK